MKLSNIIKIIKIISFSCVISIMSGCGLFGAKKQTQTIIASPPIVTTMPSQVAPAKEISSNLNDVHTNISKSTVSIDEDVQKIITKPNEDTVTIGYAQDIQQLNSTIKSQNDTIAALIIKENQLSANIQTNESTIQKIEQQYSNAFNQLKTQTDQQHTQDLLALKQSSDANLKGLYTLLGFVIVASVIGIGLGGYLCLTGSSKSGCGIIGGSIIASAAGMAILIHSPIIAICGGAFSLIMIGLLVFIVIKNQKNAIDEVVQTTAVTRAALKKADSASEAAIFGPPSTTPKVASIQSTTTSNMVNSSLVAQGLK